MANTNLEHAEIAEAFKIGEEPPFRKEPMTLLFRSHSLDRVGAPAPITSR